ncbi:MAG: isochorismatase family protein [Burkholderiaceae bacterium]
MSVSTARPWDGLVPVEERDIYRLAGLGQPTGFGERPALLVIDVQYRTIGNEPMPIRDSIERQYPTSCGEYGWRAVAHIAELIAAFRRLGFPVLFPHVAPKAAHDRGQFGEKVPGVMKIPPAGYEFVREVAPQPSEIRIPKYHASAFFGTSLASYLVSLKVDSLVVSGCTTSGCVRSSVVDACSLNYKTIVPEDAVYDRSQSSHAMNLFDMASKYADVMPTRDVIALLDELPARAARR